MTQYPWMPRRSWFRWGTRSLLALILICASVFGWLRWEIDSYRKEWLVEQRGLQQMRRPDLHFQVSMQPIGPAWLRALAGSERSKYFERVHTFHFVASEPTQAEFNDFKYVR